MKIYDYSIISLYPSLQHLAFADANFPQHDFCMCKLPLLV